MNELLREINPSDNNRAPTITESLHENRMDSSETAAKEKEQERFVETKNALSPLSALQLKSCLEYAKIKGPKEAVFVIDVATGKWTPLVPSESKTLKRKLSWLLPPKKSIKPANQDPKPLTSPLANPTVTVFPFLQSRR
ncbi:uncharacterized protein LOC106652387 [Trichogramma pretiosum]|uniref:uncharacterized protein LOC106652387 n=1 Tax=Trichogramma pretiosum TaxID=7493 RepID=UPI0006C97833|nr:uncharacterized protein LOC106652387 [Trichogramma pretiosum]